MSIVDRININTSTRPLIFKLENEQSLLYIRTFFPIDRGIQEQALRFLQILSSDIQFWVEQPDKQSWK